MDEMYFHEPRQPVFINDEIHYTDQREPKEKINSKRNVVACGIAIAFAIFLVGIGLGFWSCNLKRVIDNDDARNRVKQNERDSLADHKNIADGINSEEIEKHLRY